jgi:hypothetical protein
MSITALVLCGFLSACGSGNPDAGLSNLSAVADQTEASQLLELAEAREQGRAVGQSSGSNGTTTDTSGTGTTGSCTTQTPPSPVRTSLVGPSSPVAVPARFVGTHRSLHNPSWVSPAYAPIPDPTYRFDYVRTLKADVDGEAERGFWSNIETSPGVYNWSYMDRWMQANAGKSVIWMVYGTPAMYQKYPGEPTRWPSWPGIASPPTDAGHSALLDYVRAAKARYGSQIAAFEVWNEPTLPWDQSETSYNERWTPAWGRANAPGNPAPFFSGTASDLANIAYTLSSAGLGVPILGAGFVDQWEQYSYSVTRFLNAPVTLPQGSGTGKNHIQALSIHFYDYSFDPSRLVAVVDGYRSKLAAAGLGDLPIWGTETGAEGGGVFSVNDPRAPASIQRWVLIAAAKRLSSMVLYGHVSGDDAVRFLGDPIRNASVIAALDKVYTISGSTICNAAVLQDGRVWVTTSAGKQFLI